MQPTHAKPGEAWMWGGPGGVRMINLITQDGGYGHGGHADATTIKHVRNALRALARIVEREGLSYVALPRLATGVGALRWADVRPVIEERLGGLAIPVYVYAEFHAGQQADEPASGIRHRPGERDSIAGSIPHTAPTGGGTHADADTRKRDRTTSGFRTERNGRSTTCLFAVCYRTVPAVVYSSVHNFRLD